MLLRDEDVRHGALARQVRERVLDCAAIVHLVQLDGVELCARVGQKLLRGAAVGAVRLREDGDGVLVDDGLDFGLGGGHGCWAGGAGEEVPQERYGCGVGG